MRDVRCWRPGTCECALIVEIGPPPDCSMLALLSEHTFRRNASYGPAGSPVRPKFCFVHQPFAHDLHKLLWIIRAEQDAYNLGLHAVADALTVHPNELRIYWSNDRQRLLIDRPLHPLSLAARTTANAAIRRLGLLIPVEVN